MISRTDRHALRWILNFADATGKLARQRLMLFEHDLEITHRAGVKHQAAEALSELLTTGVDSTEIEDEILVTVVTGNKNRDRTNMSVVPSEIQKKKNPPLKTFHAHVADLTKLSYFIIAQSKNAFC